jgi:prevent-host-death family protein
MAKIYSTQEAKARFSEVLRRVRSGEHVVISFRGEPVAEVSPYANEDERLEERWERLKRAGRLVPARPGARKLGLRPVARRPGALKRFLETRD